MFATLHTNFKNQQLDHSNYLTGGASTWSTLKKSSFTLLKEHQKQYETNQKHQIKKINKNKYLKSQIDQNNNNIFQILPNKKQMTAQNIIWKKKYELKIKINCLKEQNSSLRAKIWNVQKQNRKMQKQIQNWGLNSYLKNNSFSKPYIDTAAVQKVFEDQDYSITSLKIQIIQLQKQLTQKNQLLQGKTKVISNIANLKKDLDRTLCEKKTKFYQFMLINKTNQCKQQDEYQQSVVKQKKIEEMKSKVKEEYRQKIQQIQLLKKNTQMKKKSKVTLLKQVEQLNKQLQLRKGINESEIITLKKMSQKMRNQDESFIAGEEAKLQKIKEERLRYQCQMQDWMGSVIKKKMKLQTEIAQTKHNIQEIQKQQKKLLVKSKNSIL